MADEDRDIALMFAMPACRSGFSNAKRLAVIILPRFEPAG